MKVCTKCKIEKELTEFSKDKPKKDGLQYECKSCQKKYNKEYRKKNKEREKERVKKWREQNKERKKKYNKEWREQNKERVKKWREQNKEYMKEYLKEWNKQNKEYKKEYLKEWSRERRKTDPLFKMKCNLRSRTYQAFRDKGYSKNTKTQEMLGVDWEVCKAHIERQFTKGMSWDNYGEWHIDHIIPLASADTEQRIKELCHYTNLQPLWSEDNLSKSDKINGQQTKIRI